jgi:hypothetical protein
MRIDLKCAALRAAHKAAGHLCGLAGIFSLAAGYIGVDTFAAAPPQNRRAAPVLFALLQQDATPRPPLFPEYPPTADADPSIRHEVEVPMPTRLSVQRMQSRLSVSFDLASPRKVKIAVGRKMSIGVKYELRVYEKGDARPQDAVVGYAGVREPVITSSPGFLSGTTFFNSGQGGIPAPGKRYIVEEDISLFETDVPPQHMWNVASGGRYRVLWRKKLKTEA